MQTETITRTRSTRLALAGVAAVVLWLALAPDARAEGYSVVECTPGGDAHPNPNAADASYDQSSNINVAAVLTCNNDGYLGSAVPTSAHQGHWASWSFQAPAGTYIDSGALEYSMDADAGYGAYVRLDNFNGGQPILASGANTDWQLGLYDGDASSTTLRIYLMCESSAGCGGAWAAALARKFLFNMQDVARPHNLDIGGGLATSAWLNGSRTFTLSASDQGSGVRNFQFYVNGSNIDNDGLNCDAWGDGYAARMQPCPSSATQAAPDQNVNNGSWHQGQNSIQGCVSDYSGERTCQSRTVNVDTVAPDSVSGLTVDGGEAWRPTNDFDVSWSNPAQAHAPIDGAMYRIARVGGGYDSGAQFVSGANRQSLNDLTVPSPGEYQLKTWARDAAGNSSEANARTATLRFDPTVPPEAEAEYNGWIRRHDFEYEAKWQPIDPGELGPSGLGGYAVRVTRSPDSDPCVTAGHPASNCSSAEVNNKGIGDVEMPISAAEVAEGEWYIHVVPVTGAGVKASSVEHTAMPVDETDPESTIDGAGFEWVNHDVTVSVSANDSLSGMTPRPDHPMDPQPRTCLQIGAGGADCEPDDTITRVISAEGAHEVRYFARDLAGNENNGRPDVQFPSKVNNPPNASTVRIDKSGPQLAFVGARNVEDPSRVAVNVSDALSGLAQGTIELRRQGSNSGWLELDTDLSADSLSGHVPDDIDPGRYEFRATATDQAGNTSSTSSRADGTPMVEELPLKEAVHLTASVEGAKAESPKGKCKKSAGRGKGRCKCKKSAGRGKGKCKKPAPADSATVPYGVPIQLRGYLQTAADAPLRGRELTVTEKLAEGAAPDERRHTVVTDQSGGYSIDLEAGPSRTVTVKYGGDSRYRAAATGPVDVAVRSKVVSFKSPKTVPESRAIRFRGRIGAKGVDLGSRGKRIELQYEKAKGKWKTIDAGEAKAEGRFKLRYGLRSNYVRRTKVRFRVLVPAERAWPYSGTATSPGSKTVILP